MYMGFLSAQSYIRGSATWLEDHHGLCVFGCTDRLFRIDCGHSVRLRTPAETVVSWVYVLSSVLALGILIYLVVALLFPEKF
jgi:K+-transporting ATPase KdpF subunit